MPAPPAARSPPSEKRSHAHAIQHRGDEFTELATVDIGVGCEKAVEGTDGDGCAEQPLLDDGHCFVDLFLEFDCAPA